MPASVLNHQKKAEHMEAALPMKDKEEVTLSEGERDSKEKVVMAVAKDTAIMEVAKGMAITMVVISDSIVAHPIAIGTMCRMKSPRRIPAISR